MKRPLLTSRFSSQSCILAAAAFLTFSPSAHALILFGGDNNTNITNPMNGLPWDSVAKLTNAAGTAVAPSAVYLGNGYMLTANHVDLSSGYVTFETSSTTYAIDTSFTATQVAPGVDMKIFKLQTPPPVTAVNLLSTAIEESATATMVGWGVGRDPAETLGDTSVVWGNDSTATKRWGINMIYADTLSYAGSGGPYSYSAISTFAGSTTGGGLGANESASTRNDSGSGLFQQIGGTWYLIGLTTVVQTDGTSNFGEDPASAAPAADGDKNGYVRISSYYSNIMAVVPEPRTYALIALGLGFVGISLRYRKTRA